MVLDNLSQKERQGVFAAAGLAVVAALAVGYGAGSITSPTGDFAAGGSPEEVRTVAESVVQQQEASQQQRMALMANQSENISEEDLSFSAEVENVSRSDIGSLYRADISVSGDTVSQLGQVQSVDQTQTLYISSDGRYLFQSPTDLEAQRQRQQPQTRPAPSGQ
jgi:hypothetical protein